MGYFDQYKKNDPIKQKLLKYILFKKRTEKEVRIKLAEILEKSDCSELENITTFTENLIEDLKEQGYINDQNYIERSIAEFIMLKTLSIMEIKNKLLLKGIDKELIEEYISNNKEMLEEYELNSAKKVAQKKSTRMDQTEIKQYLIKKGFNNF